MKMAQSVLAIAVALFVSSAMAAGSDAADAHAKNGKPAAHMKAKKKWAHKKAKKKKAAAVKAAPAPSTDDAADSADMGDHHDMMDEQGSETSAE